MIFDCHFRHAIASIDYPYKSTGIYPHLSIAQRRPAIQSFDYFLTPIANVVRPFNHSIISSIDCQRLHNVVRPFNHSIISSHRLPTSSGHSIIRLLHQSIAQGLHPGLGCVASSTLERMNFIPPRCIFQQPLFSSFSNLHTILWISNNLHVDGSISS